MKKITIMSIVLAILVAMTTSVFAAETSTTATVTAPAEVVEGTSTVDIKISLKDTVVCGKFTVDFGTAGVLKYKSSNLKGNVTGDDKGVSAEFYDTSTKEIVITCDVIGKVGSKTKVNFTPIDFGENADDYKKVTVEGTAPTVTVVAKQAETTPPAGENKPGNTTTNETTTTTSNETTTTPANETTTTPANETVTEKATSDDEYDQTGMNVGVIAGIALAVVLGTAVVVKRK